MKCNSQVNFYWKGKLLPQEFQQFPECKIYLLQCQYEYVSYLFCVDGDCLMATWASSDKALSGELGLMRIP